MTPDPYEPIPCDQCQKDCAANPFFLVHNDGTTDGPVCQTCATILNGA